MGDDNEIRDNPVSHNIPGVTWVFVRPDWISNLLNFPNRKGYFIYSFYLAYYFWHRKVYKTALGVVKNSSVDLIHYLGPIGYREPGFLWRIDRPYIWGPIGGVKNRPSSIYFQRKKTSVFNVWIRNALNAFQLRFKLRLKKALKQTNLLLSSTSETQEIIKKIHRKDSILIPENGIIDECLRNQKIINYSAGRLKMIWVGRIDHHKSLDILLRALAKTDSDSWSLYVIGDGNNKDKCQVLAKDLGINKNIEWTGKLNRSEVNRYYSQSHLHVITSLMEANTTVVWEAMSFGIPTISLDHCGMHDVICEKCGIKISLTTYQSTIDEFARKIQKLIDHPEIIGRLSFGVSECSKDNVWSSRRLFWNSCYDQAVNNWMENQH